ncbi:1412_t:CDS:2, partial [Ambispora gerdemannii]
IISLKEKEENEFLNLQYKEQDQNLFLNNTLSESSYKIIQSELSSIDQVQGTITFESRAHVCKNTLKSRSTIIRIPYNQKVEQDLI